ncbi:hypothetical protein INT44_004514 [Umbelopsis vinacea]|uniref:Ctf8 n=1 Tax=Umbelopsis vinacea TaxID=44442 RepID=A0A8H7QBC4_9FUNG|nr:hypothetical protein INT44_004514 [Umbelopsis vinacea]
MTTQIVISNLQDSHNQDESVILIEFQGTLECEQDDIRGLKVGDLEENDQGMLFLTVGHHKLEGKKTKLSKPLAVITKRFQQDVDSMDLDQPQSVTYDVVNILKEKYVFAHRPSLLVQEDLRGLMKV